MKRQLAIEYRPIASLIPYANNARTHSKEQIAQIAASIREFGWTNPILVDGASGIIAGHGRVLAARDELGMDAVPCIELASLSESQRRAYVIADNKLALNAGWDEALLRLELTDLRGMAFDLSLIGFGEREVEQLFAPDLDPNVEMPDFNQEDKTAFRRISMHFQDQGAVDQFARLIKQKITEKTRFAWYPAPPPGSSLV